MAQLAVDVETDLFGLNVEVRQNLVVVSCEREQDVLRGDIVGPEREGVAKRELEQLAGAWRKWEVGVGEGD